MSSAVEIFNSIADGKDGTLDTITVYELPRYGYFVGGNGEALVFESVTDANTPDALRKITGFIDATEARFVGWWTDSETGKVYIDGTDWFADIDKASRAAQERGEIAFWDIEGQAEIRTEV